MFLSSQSKAYECAENASSLWTDHTLTSTAHCPG
jgi:hypothetical protein